MKKYNRTSSPRLYVGVRRTYREWRHGGLDEGWACRRDVTVTCAIDAELCPGACPTPGARCRPSVISVRLAVKRANNGRAAGKQPIRYAWSHDAIVAPETDVYVRDRIQARLLYCGNVKCFMCGVRKWVEITAQIVRPSKWWFCTIFYC